MNGISSLRNSSLWLLPAILAGCYIFKRFIESAAGFSIIPSLSIIQASNVNNSMDFSWHAPISSEINSLRLAINGTGTYGFVFNSSTLPEECPYGIMKSACLKFRRLNSH